MANTKKQTVQELEKKCETAKTELTQLQQKLEDQKKFLKMSKKESIRPLVVLILMVVSVIAFTVFMKQSALWEFFYEIASDDPAEKTEAFVTQVAYTFYGLTYLVLAPIGAGWLGIVLAVIGLIATLVTEMAIIIPLGMLAVVIRLIAKLAEPGGYKKTIAELEEQVSKQQGKVKNAESKLAKAKDNISRAAELFRQGKKEKNLDLIRQAAGMDNEDAIEYLEKVKAEELYAQAMAGDEPDMDLMEQAADLDHPAACKAMGLHLINDANDETYTARERESTLRTAADYLYVAAEDGDVEAEFLRITCRIRYESNSKAGWKEMLDRVRKIKKSKKLPEQWHETCEEVLKALVAAVDKLDARAEEASVNKEPQVKRKYCAYENCGVCTFYSTGSYLAHCDYMRDPGQCSAALMNNGLRFEFN